MRTTTELSLAGEGPASEVDAVVLDLCDGCGYAKGALCTCGGAKAAAWDGDESKTVLDAKKLTSKLDAEFLEAYLDPKTGYMKPAKYGFDKSTFSGTKADLLVVDDIDWGSSVLDEKSDPDAMPQSTISTLTYECHPAIDMAGQKPATSIAIAHEWMPSTKEYYFVGAGIYTHKSNLLWNYAYTDELIAPAIPFQTFFNSYSKTEFCNVKSCDCGLEKSNSTAFYCMVKAHNHPDLNIKPWAKHPYPGVFVPSYAYIKNPQKVGAQLIFEEIPAAHFTLWDEQVCNNKVCTMCENKLDDQKIEHMKAGTQPPVVGLPKTWKGAGLKGMAQKLRFPAFKWAHFVEHKGTPAEKWFCNSKTCKGCAKSGHTLLTKKVVALALKAEEAAAEKADWYEEENVTVVEDDEELDTCAHGASEEECGTEHCSGCGEPEICEHCYDNECSECCGVEHCKNCGSDLAYIDECDEMADGTCTDCCGCNYCESCEKHVGYGGSAGNWCSGCCYCTDCGCSCDESDSDGEGHGTLKQAPWEARGIEFVEAQMKAKFEGDWDNYIETWGFDPSKTDVCRAMCDFYILEGVAGVAFNAIPEVRLDPRAMAISAQARELLTSKIDYLDDVFRRYVDMVVGGELRHHRAVRKRVLHYERPLAWRQWKEIREKVGTQALRDAIELFKDFHSGSFGGEAWANCTDILLKRETGVFDKLTFIDRVFDAQHNGGSLLNKVEWQTSSPGRFNYHHIKQGLGDAHASDPPGYGPLLLTASFETRLIFSRWWKATNRVRVEQGLKPTTEPTWKSSRFFVNEFYWHYKDYELLSGYLNHDFFRGLDICDENFEYAFGDFDEWSKRLHKECGKAPPTKKPVSKKSSLTGDDLYEAVKKAAYTKYVTTNSITWDLNSTSTTSSTSW
jgi:hypothetical protein